MSSTVHNAFLQPIDRNEYYVCIVPTRRMHVCAAQFNDLVVYILVLHAQDNDIVIPTNIYIIYVLVCTSGMRNRSKIYWCFAGGAPTYILNAIIRNFKLYGRYVC